ncbi:MAG: hydrogenase maturation nickel metallochaperone HypA [Candidatus Omnitrophota bacterium]
MHELTITKNLISVLEKETVSHEIGKVKNVYLEVGKMRYIVPEIMNASFENMPKCEKLKGAKLKIKILPIMIQCVNCKKEFELDEYEDFCRSCNSKGNTCIISGDEFNLKGIEW